MAIVARRMKRCLWFASVVKLATHGRTNIWYNTLIFSGSGVPYFWGGDVKWAKRRNRKSILRHRSSGT